MAAELYKKYIGNISYFDKGERALVRKAFLFAKKKHEGQKRRSGEPYINHPLRVSNFLAESKHDLNTVIAGLLHDTIEDTETSFEEIKEIFGDEIAKIVEGVTKVSSIKIKSKSKIFSDKEIFINQVENYRKLLVATVSDLRVIIVKLHDRLDNIMTLEYIPVDKRKFYARETIEIFAPIAERLGIGEIKGQLEDYAFKYAYPSEYKKFLKISKTAYQDPKETVEQVIPKVKDLLHESKTNYDHISGRAKHLYSLYLKLKRKKDIRQIFDIVALRIIVENIGDCYKTLGLIHSLYKPLPGRIYDYIARPKDSGYQSLHTTVKDKDGNIFEIQIRTKKMHDQAENGPAAHWNYKENTVGLGQKDNKDNREWLSELKKIEDLKGENFINVVKEELFSKRIFVFTPEGDIVNLPQGSCGVDFAYRIHTELGNHCRGVRINDRLMPLPTQLESRDIVEIISSKNAVPSKHWLTFVKTSYAKTKIKNFFKEKNPEESYEIGLKKITEILSKHNQSLDPAKVGEILSKSHLPYKDYHSAVIAIGDGSLRKTLFLKTVIPSIFKKKARKSIAKSEENISEINNTQYQIAGCCKPKKTDNRVYYINRDHKVKIHKKECKKIATADKRRIFELNDNKLTI